MIQCIFIVLVDVELAAVESATSSSEVGMLIEYTLSGSRILGVRQSQLGRLLAA